MSENKTTPETTPKKTDKEPEGQTPDHPIGKAVKKAAEAAATKKSSIKKSGAKKSTAKKSSPKKSSPKTPDAKTSDPKKSDHGKAAPKKIAIKDSTRKESAAEKVVAADEQSMQALIDEMNSQRQSRDKQIASLIEEVRDGFSTLASNASKQDQEHQQEMTGLYKSLQGAFGQIKESNTDSEAFNLNIFKSLSDSMVNDHEQTLSEIKEERKLQDKKIEHMAKMIEQRTGRNRLIAIPGVIIAMLGIFYMFYVVSIMESAMSNMSANMQLMQEDVGAMTGSVASMSGNIGTISNDTRAMSSNLEYLNGNVGNMGKDLNILTHNVAPAMKGMRNVMPWAP